MERGRDKLNRLADILEKHDITEAVFAPMIERDDTRAEEDAIGNAIIDSFQNMGLQGDRLMNAQGAFFDNNGRIKINDAKNFLNGNHDAIQGFSRRVGIGEDEVKQSLDLK